LLGFISNNSHLEACLAAPIPWTVQLFLWCACNNILPTKEKLCQHRIVEDPLCPMCGRHAESTTHAIWSCDAARAVWTECPTRIQNCDVMEGNFLTLFGELSSRLKKADLELIAIVAQRIWFRRNRYVFEGVIVSPTYLLKSAKEAFEDYRQTIDPDLMCTCPVGLVFFACSVITTTSSYC
jgi:hypothetical protein